MSAANTPHADALLHIGERNGVELTDLTARERAAVIDLMGAGMVTRTNATLHLTAKGYFRRRVLLLPVLAERVMPDLSLTA